MEESFKIFREQLDRDAEKNSKMNPFQALKEEYKQNKIGFYDFLETMQSYNKVLYQMADHLSSTGIAKIEISDNNVIFTTRPDNIKLLFNGRERLGVPFEFINWGFYEKSEYELYNNLLSDGMTILDVGANIGWYSLLWGKKFLNSKIHAFEPIPDIYKYLSTNLVINGINNVIPHGFGLSDQNAVLSFYFNPMITGLSSSQNVLRYSGVKEIQCNVQTLDSFSNSLKIKPVDLIKCDVEGAELSVLKGAIETIKRDAPMIVLELFHEWSCAFDYYPDVPIEILKNMGYRCFLPLNGRLEEMFQYVPNEYGRQNYFFLHRDNHAKLISEWLYQR